MERDISNFTSSPPHRTATQSAAAALENGPRRATPGPVSTGLRELDAQLRPAHPASNAQGGFQPGQLIELYGPPGSGKTALALQAAANVLHDGGSVVWVDTANQVSRSRLLRLLDSKDSEEPADAQLERLYHFVAPTLPHLLALLGHPPPGFPPPGTRLVIIDTVSRPIDTAYPSYTSSKTKPYAEKANLNWAGRRKWEVIAGVAATSARLASSNNLAVAMLSQMTTKSVQKDGDAFLLPMFNTMDWVAQSATRILLYRDFAQMQGTTTTSDPAEATVLRFAVVAKVNENAHNGISNKVAFTIEQTGLCQSTQAGATAPPPLSLPGALELPPPSKPSLTVRLKRKRDAEVADSESEASSSDGLEPDHEDLQYLDDVFCDYDYSLL